MPLLPAGCAPNAGGEPVTPVTPDVPLTRGAGGGVRQALRGDDVLCPPEESRIDIPLAGNHVAGTPPGAADDVLLRGIWCLLPLVLTSFK